MPLMPFPSNTVIFSTSGNSTASWNSVMQPAAWLTKAVASGCDDLLSIAPTNLMCEKSPPLKYSYPTTLQRP